MRFAILALALLAPVAAGAADPLGVSVAVTPFEGPVAVLETLAETDVTATVSCALLANAPPGGAATVQFAVVESPSWTAPTVTPSTVTLALPSACDAASQTAVARSRLTVAALVGAPAFEPAPIVVAASIQGPAGKQEAKGNATVEADWLSLLSVEAASTLAIVAPGQSATFPLTVRNEGNAAIDVLVSAEGVEAGWNVSIESPRGVPAGGSAVVRVEVTPGEAASPGPKTVTLSFLSRLSSDPGRMGDETRASLIVTVKDPVSQLARGIPAAPGAWVGLALAAAALVARRVAK